MPYKKLPHLQLYPNCIFALPDTIKTTLNGVF